MKYISTRNGSKEYNFEQIFIKGLADDGGLFVPKSLKKFSKEELSKFKNLDYNESFNKKNSALNIDFEKLIISLFHRLKYDW